MILGTDSTKRVVMEGSGFNVKTMPAEFNGESITAHLLTAEKAQEYYALPVNRQDVYFDGVNFSVTYPNPTAAQIAEKSIYAIESANPVTQRALRELILAIGDVYPNAQATMFYQKAAAQEAEIAPLREQL